tara:strand:- start:423 stop:2369 length:1947 start_codon:yes stop_codon:yes gene_type:complete
MSFLASIYLWFLPFTLIPIIFHFLKKRNYKNIKFSTTRFLIDMKEDSLKKINLINILLLIIRTLIILFLILMISKPIFNSYNRDVGNGEDTMVLILVDDSYSNYNFLNDNLSSILNKIMNNYDPNSYISIKGLSGKEYISFEQIKEPKSIEKFNTYNFGSYEISKDNFSFSHTVDNFLNKDLYLITDLDNYIFNDIQNIDISSWNIFIYEHNQINHPIIISDLFSNENIIVNNNIISFFVTGTNLTDLKHNNINIELFLNNIKVSDNTIDFEPNESKKVEFQTSFPNKELYNCYFKVNNYKYYFNINVDTERNIALLYTDITDVTYVKSALNAYNDFYENLKIDEFFSENFLNTNNKYSSIIKFGTSDLDKNLIANIFFKTSKLIVVPSKSFYLDDLRYFFNDISISNKEQKTITNGNLIVSRNYKNSSELDLIFKRNKTDIKINKYFNLESTPYSKLYINSQNSLLNEYTSNNNSLSLLSIPLDINSSTLPLSASFIPFLNYLLKLTDFSKYNYINDEIYIEEQYKKQIITHYNNDVSYKYNNGYFKDNKFLIKKPGFHKFYANGFGIKNIAANIKLSELNTVKIDKKLLNDQLNGIIIIDSVNDIENTLKSIITGIHLWKYLLYVILILLIIEMYISNIYLYKKND